MNKTVVNIVCVVLLAGVLLYPKYEQYTPDFKAWFGPVASESAAPSNTYGFNTSIPQVLKDKAVAHKLSGLFAGLADVIAHDASRTKPEVKYASNLRDVISEAVNLEFDSDKLGKVAPGLGGVIGPVFEKEFPDGTVELDATSRQKAVEIFRAASYGCSLVK